MQLQDRAVLITGGRRLGAAVAVELARRGADVALTYHRSREAAERTAAAVRACGRRGLVVPADLARPTECARAVQDTVDGLGRLDVLVHMASRYRSVPLEQATEADWEEGLAADLRAAFFCAQAAVAPMRAVGGGRIVLLSDWLAASRRPRYRGYVPYYVAKAGVVALAEALALELAADGILVNAVAPGPILPPEGATLAEQEAVARATPVGRWGGADEVVKIVVALIESDFVTGETVRVDGGRHLR
jgi:NAD(P)-dependent dehydrogenase (short-subunit alcohol dehydrogenase family)